MCDIVFKVDDKLHGDIFTTRALLESLKDLNVSKVAIIGTDPHAKSFSIMGCGFKLSYFNDNLEELMSFCSEMDISNADINRIADGMSIDFSDFDAVLDFSNMSSFDMVEKLALHNFDMKNSKEYSALKTRAHQLELNYTSYDDMIDKLTSTAYARMKPQINSKSDTL
jgi:hypothetical protein